MLMQRRFHTHLVEEKPSQPEKNQQQARTKTTKRIKTGRQKDSKNPAKNKRKRVCKQTILYRRRAHFGAAKVVDQLLLSVSCGKRCLLCLGFFVDNKTSVPPVGVAHAAHSHPPANTTAGEVRCSTCASVFAPRFAYQRDESSGEMRYFCSLMCKASAAASQPICSVCRKQFVLKFAYQVNRQKTGNIYLCSEECRNKALAIAQAARPAPQKVAYCLAVLNQKGGTGKTTTSISLAAGLAEAKRRVLLIDADPQGNVGVSLGIRTPQTLCNIMNDDAAITDVVFAVNDYLDILTADDTLALAERKMAAQPMRTGILRRKIDEKPLPYDFIIIDCGPALSMLNQNALCAAHEVLIPVACDYLSLVGVKQVLKTIKGVNQELGHPLRVGAVLPTLYDQRLRICQESLEALRKHFGASCLEPIRINTKLKEAPSHRKSIFEYDQYGAGAGDYRRVVEYFQERLQGWSAAQAQQAQQVQQNPQAAQGAPHNSPHNPSHNAPQNSQAPQPAASIANAAGGPVPAPVAAPASSNAASPMAPVVRMPVR